MREDTPAFRAQAWVLGARLDTSGLPADDLVAHGPNTYVIGPDAWLCAFRYGAVVFFGASEAEQAEWVGRLAPFVDAPLAQPDRDALEIRVDPDAESERLDRHGRLVLHMPSVERLQVVAHVLAKSTVLGHYEERVASAFSRVEKRARMREPGLGRRQSQALLTEIGEALAIQVQTVGRIETTEKPETVWDAPALDRLYDLLSVEFELRERDAALTRKLQLISESASTSLELIHTRRALRVEWYIVALIAVEIVLFVYDLAVGI